MSEIPENEVDSQSSQSPELLKESALNMVSNFNSADISKYTVIGDCVRFDERDRGLLNLALRKISTGLKETSQKRENHLLWGLPGQGKTFFVQQLAANSPGIEFVEINLAEADAAQLQECLNRVTSSVQPTLCLIDEADSKTEDRWPYELIIAAMDKVWKTAPVVFVLAGSGGRNVEQLANLIGDPKRWKGRDAVTRTDNNRISVPPLQFGDRVLVFIANLLRIARKTNQTVRSIDRWALYYIAVGLGEVSSRALGELAARALERLGNEDTITYGMLFDEFDDARYDFRNKYPIERETLKYRFAPIDTTTTPTQNMNVALTSENAPEYSHRKQNESGESTNKRVCSRSVDGGIPEFPDTFGRSNEIRELQALVAKYTVVCIHGGPGVGKTYLAAQLASSWGTNTEVKWIERDELTIDAFLSEMNDFLVEHGDHTFEPTYNQPEVSSTSKITALIGILSEKRNPSVLVVLDRGLHDSRNRQDFIPLIERITTHGRELKLLTLEESPLDNVLGSSLSRRVGHYLVGGLRREEAANYIKSQTEASGIKWTEADIDALWNSIAGHPLMLNLVVSCVNDLVPIDQVLREVIANPVKYDEVYGSELRRRLVDRVAERMSTVESDALHRLSLFRASAPMAAWTYLDISKTTGEALIRRRLLSPVGSTGFTMHQLLRQFWYDASAAPSWHKHIADFYSDRSTEASEPSLIEVNALESHYHFLRAQLPDKAADLINDVIRRLHKIEPLTSGALATLTAWVLESTTELVAGRPWLMLFRGHIELRSSDLNTAYETYISAVRDFQSSSDKWGEAVAHYYCARVAIHLRTFSLAKSHLESSIAISRPTSDPPLQIRSWNKLADVYTATKQYELAADAANDAMDLASTTGDMLGVGLSQYRKAKISRRQGHLVRAAEQYAEAASTFSKVGDIYRESKALSRRGVALGLLGRFDEAVQSLEQALDLKRSINDSQGLAIDLDYLGELRFFQGAFAPATQCHRESLELKSHGRASEPDWYGIVKSRCALARVVAAAGETTDATSHLQFAEQHLATYPEIAEHLRPLWHITSGELHLAKGETHEAIDDFKAALRIHRRSTIAVHDEVRARIGLGAALGRDGRVETSQRQLNLALTATEEHSLGYLNGLASLELAKLYAAIGNLANAQYFLEAAQNQAAAAGAKYSDSQCQEAMCVIDWWRVLMLQHTGDLDDSALVQERNRVAAVIEKTQQQYLAVGAKLDADRMILRKYIWLVYIAYLRNRMPDMASAYGLVSNPGSGRTAMRSVLSEEQQFCKLAHGMVPPLARVRAELILYVTTPLASLSGLSEMRRKVEDCAFEFLEPARFQDLAKAIEEYYPERSKVLRQWSQTLAKLLEAAGISYSAEPFGRVKTIGSIARKQNLGDLRLDQIFDYVALRVIVDSEEDCYKALRAILSEYGNAIVSDSRFFAGVGGGIRDFIAEPKANGYRSIHLTLCPAELHGRPIEIQIRTLEMHMAAEYGFDAIDQGRLSHWNYKKAQGHLGHMNRRHLDQTAGLGQEVVFVECSRDEIGTVGRVLRGHSALQLRGIDVESVGKGDGSESERIVLRLRLTFRTAQGRVKPLREIVARVIEELRSSVSGPVENSTIGFDLVAAVSHRDPASPGTVQEKGGLVREVMSSLGGYVYVLTPDGEIKRLILGATSIDFAYSVHEEVGNSAVGARINGKWESLSYKLKSGDRVEIQTKPSGTPTAHWLEIAATPRARTKIRKALRRGNTRLSSKSSRSE